MARQKLKRELLDQLDAKHKFDPPPSLVEQVYNQMRQRLKANAIPIQIPIGAEERFAGVIDLVRMKAIFWDEASMGMQFELRDIPAELADEAKASLIMSAGQMAALNRRVRVPGADRALKDRKKRQPAKGGPRQR